MFPLKDENPTIRTPYVTITFIVICSIVWLLQIGASDPDGVIRQWGLTPGLLTGAGTRGGGVAGAGDPLLTIFTSMFMHGSWFHLIGNMVFLWVFGNNIEDVLGHGRFIIFYLAIGIAAAMAQVLAGPDSMIPMVGASGAISGVLGAYIILFPHARILTLLFLGIFITWVKIRAIWFLGIWFIMQFVSMSLQAPGEGGVAFWAHIGGFVAGAILVFFMKPRAFIMGNGRKGPWG